MTYHAPGEPPAAAISEQLADLVVENPGQPNDGQVWTYEASKGGYVIADAAGRQDDDTICDDVGAVYVYTGAVVVRPVAS